METKKGTKVHKLASLFILFMLLGISLPSSAWAGYTYTEIIPPGWEYDYAYAINDSGDIVGLGYDANGVGKGFLYSGGNYTRIIPPDCIAATAWDINDGGDIVGYGVDANYVTKGFVATLQSVCSTWSDVLAKYQAYKNGQATFGDVIECYIEWREHSPLGQ